MTEHKPRIEIIVGEVIPNGQQWLKLCVNGRLTDLIMHVDPKNLATAQQQLEHVASQMYQWGFFDGARDAKVKVRSALDIQ
ncbi:hypothetical protein [Kordiimonas sp.]|uniref:hypothetical protein n=1 Tax=Kordiimonas sp. TaxID=1970157 RepID=UPI003A924B99